MIIKPLIAASCTSAQVPMYKNYRVHVHLTSWWHNIIINMAFVKHFLKKNCLEYFLRKSETKLIPANFIAYYVLRGQLRKFCEYTP
jgi:hypothetical protein